AELEMKRRIRVCEREDCTLVAWYLCITHPRTGGAHDSHHQTAGIAGRTWRRCGRVAAHGARAAAGEGTHHSVSRRRVTRISMMPVMKSSADNRPCESIECFENRQTKDD